MPDGDAVLEQIQISPSPQDAKSHQTGTVFSVYYNERPSSLLSILQTEIELLPLLRLYLEQVRQRESLDGLILHWRGQQYIMGNIESSYRLTMEWTIDDNELVKLAYVSNHPFNSQKHRQLDWMQRQLHFPLRNSLRYEAMRQHSRTDHLTRLGNRAAFDELAASYVAQARRSQQRIALLMLDLNHFKQVNDTQGHTTGDRVLQAAADCLRDATRDTDLAFRFGGDEYAILLTHCHDRACDVVQERIQEQFNEHHLLSKLGVTTSIGAAEWTPADNVETWLCRADESMYIAKRAYHQKRLFA